MSIKCIFGHKWFYTTVEGFGKETSVRSCTRCRKMQIPIGHNITEEGWIDNWNDPLDVTSLEIRQLLYELSQTTKQP